VQNDRGEESDIDVARELEDVIILPLLNVSAQPEAKI